MQICRFVCTGKFKSVKIFDHICMHICEHICMQICKPIRCKSVSYLYHILKGIKYIQWISEHMWIDILGSCLDSRLQDVVKITYISWTGGYQFLNQMAIKKCKFKLRGTHKNEHLHRRSTFPDACRTGFTLSSIWFWTCTANDRYSGKNGQTLFVL